MDKNKAPLEIERKWMVKGWPEKDLPLIKEEIQRQGYLVTRPTVRIREENITLSNAPSIPVSDHYVLCFKSKGLLTRKEIEIEIEKDKFEELEEMIGLPLVDKTRRTYQLKDGLKLEVNEVDRGLPSSFFYAEIEYENEEQAESYDPQTDGLQEYLKDDVTKQPGQSMGAYWEETRLANEKHGA
jgi:adenylate cyclase